MLNIEKFKNKIIEEYKKDYDRKSFMCIPYYLRNGNDCPETDCIECLKKNLNWLCEEYKEPILTDKEREYLSAFIKPFKNVIGWISKNPYRDDFEYIDFKYTENNGYQIMTFPLFEKGTMYKGMRLGKEYTLEELGL